jgi:hypothetical protein
VLVESANEVVIGHLADDKSCGFLGTGTHAWHREASGNGSSAEWVAFMVLLSATATVGPSKMGVCLQEESVQ